MSPTRPLAVAAGRVSSLLLRRWRGCLRLHPLLLALRLRWRPWKPGRRAKLHASGPVGSASTHKARQVGLLSSSASRHWHNHRVRWHEFSLRCVILN